MNKKQRLQKKLDAIWGIKKRPRYQQEDARSVVSTDESPLSNPISAHLKNLPSELKRIMGRTLSQLINEKWQDEEPRVDASYPSPYPKDNNIRHTRKEYVDLKYL